MVRIKGELQRLDAELLGSSLDEDTDIVRICMYGNPGSGKTTSAAHLALLGDVMFFPIEDGLKKAPLKRLGVPVDRIHPQQTESSQDVIDKYWDIKALTDKDPQLVAGCVLDTATELVNRSVAQITRREYPKRVRLAAARGEEYAMSRFFREIEYWGEMTGEVREVIELYRTLPCHLVFTAHVRRDEDKNTGDVRYGPAVTPAVQGDLSALTDILMYTRVVGVYADGTEIFIGSTGGVAPFEAKDRFGVLPMHMAVPTMDRIVAYVNGELVAANDEVQQRYEQWRRERTELEDEVQQAKEKARAARRAARKAKQEDDE